MQTQHSRRHLISLLVVGTVVFSAATHTSAWYRIGYRRSLAHLRREWLAEEQTGLSVSPTLFGAIR